MQKRNREIGEEVTGSAEIMLAGYEMLRLRGRHWRRLVDYLAGPAFRLHGYRSASTRIWREALCELDCGDSDVRGSACHE